jgi:hypothetical protein
MDGLGLCPPARSTDPDGPTGTGPDADLHAGEARVEAELLGVELHVQLDLALGDRLLQLRSALGACSGSRLPFEPFASAYPEYGLEHPRMPQRQPRPPPRASRDELHECAARSRQRIAG